MKVLVIGGAGFIGSALIEKLVRYGVDTTVLDVFLYGNESIKPFADKIKITKSDFRDFAVVEKAMQGMDAVVHLGAIVGDKACDIDKDLTLDINQESAVKIYEMAVKLGIKKFIFSSTCSVYGANEYILDEHSITNPLSLYGTTKVLAESYMRQVISENTCLSILRFGTVFGLSGRSRFDLVINLFAAQAVHDKKITVFGGNQWRPFVHVKDAARAIFHILKSQSNWVRGRTFNVCYGNYTIQEAAEIIQSAIPGVEIINNGNAKDPRDYFVLAQEIESIGFKPRFNFFDGIQQVKNAIENGLDYKASIHDNFKYLSEGAIKILQDFKRSGK